jgi:hypothetical protein
LNDPDSSSYFATGILFADILNLYGKSYNQIIFED